VVLKSEACLVRARKAEHEGNARIAEIVAAVKAAV
jgi:ATP phosphoribosyltransferase